MISHRRLTKRHLARPVEESHRYQLNTVLVRHACDIGRQYFEVPRVGFKRVALLKATSCRQLKLVNGVSCERPSINHYFMIAKTKYCTVEILRRRLYRSGHTIAA